MIKTILPDGTLQFKHVFLDGEFVWNPTNDPVFLFFQRIKEFGERNQTLLSPELAKVCYSFEKMLERMQSELDPSIIDEDEELY